MEEIIKVENLTHTYGVGTPFERSAVQDMSLSVYRGELLGLIGHTGSGKSTLIQHLNGLLKPTGGRVLLGGRDIWEEPKKIRDVRFRVGLVFQYPEYQLFEETVRKDISFGPANMGLRGDELEKRIRDAARFAGLGEELLDKSPFALSGVQRALDTRARNLVVLPPKGRPRLGEPLFPDPTITRLTQGDSHETAFPPRRHGSLVAPRAHRTGG